MCFMSAVFDQYRPYTPQPQQQPWTWPVTSPTPAVNYPSAKEIREFIDSFKKAVEAAKVFDRLTGQPDCEDPEKAKLEERVAELERRLEEMGT